MPLSWCSRCSASRRRLAPRTRHDRCDPREPRRRRFLLFRYPPGRDGLPGRKARSYPAPSGWCRHSPRPARRRGHGPAHRAGATREPSRPLRRGARPGNPRAPRQLPAGTHARGARPGRARPSETRSVPRMGEISRFRQQRDGSTPSSFMSPRRGIRAFPPGESALRDHGTRSRPGGASIGTMGWPSPSHSPCQRSAVSGARSAPATSVSNRSSPRSSPSIQYRWNSAARTASRRRGSEPAYCSTAARAFERTRGRRSWNRSPACSNPRTCSSSRSSSSSIESRTGSPPSGMSGSCSTARQSTRCGACLHESFGAGAGQCAERAVEVSIDHELHSATLSFLVHRTPVPVRGAAAVDNWRGEDRAAPTRRRRCCPRSAPQRPSRSRDAASTRCRGRRVPQSRTGTCAAPLRLDRRAYEPLGRSPDVP